MTKGSGRSLEESLRAAREFVRGYPINRDERQKLLAIYARGYPVKAGNLKGARTPLG